MRIGTRTSDLACYQARMFCSAAKDCYREHGGGLLTPDRWRLVTIENKSASLVGVDRFTKEVDKALLDGEVDVAVHSLKDVYYEMPEGILLGCVLERVSHWDSWISLKYPDHLSAPAGTRVGFGGQRRLMQWSYLHPNFEYVEVRGNIGTRMDILRSGHVDALVLAHCAVARLGMEKYAHPLRESVYMPAPGQGTVAVVCRANNKEMYRFLQCITHRLTNRAIMAERACIRYLKATCTMPFSALAVCLNEVDIKISCYLWAEKGRGQIITRTGTDPEALGIEIARTLCQKHPNFFS